MNNVLSLKQSPLFQGLSEKELTSLADCLGCTFRTYKRDEAVFFAGDFVRDIGIVVSGRVYIVKDDIWGNSNIIAELSDGDLFAEAIVCGGVNVMPDTVRASVDTMVCFIDFRRIITTCSSACVFHTLLIRNMISAFARKNLMLSGKMEHITKRTTREKILSYLSEQSKRQNSASFAIPFDRQGMADFLSVERSSLSTELSKLKAEGVITYQKNNFTLLSHG